MTTAGAGEGAAAAGVGAADGSGAGSGTAGSTGTGGGTRRGPVSVDASAREASAPAAATVIVPPHLRQRDVVTAVPHRPHSMSMLIVRITLLDARASADQRQRLC